MSTGGQILLVYLSYRIFNKALVYVMDTQSVSYESYGAVAFESGNVHSLWRYLRAIRRPRGSSVLPGNAIWRRRRIFGTMLITTAYVVSMPTLYSAMTGYAPVLEPSVSITTDYSHVQLISCGTRDFYGTYGPSGFNAVVSKFTGKELLDHVVAAMGLRRSPPQYCVSHIR